MWEKTATFAPMKDCITPHPLVAAIPLVVLIAVLAMSVYLFGSDTLAGASQIALIFASSVVIAIAMLFYHIPWKVFDKEMRKIFGGMSVTLFILLSVGMLSGSWMISGVVPTLIYYGVPIMSPTFFLLTTCVICSLVSVLSGSSWTTVATIGVALLGIGQALNISPAWTAGAIISGAYFGDKLSPLSDTTILASSYSGTDLFVHIRYLLLTTVPSMLITLVLFLAMGLVASSDNGAIDVSVYTDGLSAKFNISLWTLCVPILTGVMIARKLPSLFVLFLRSPSGSFLVFGLENRKPCRKKVDHSGACQHEGPFSPVRVFPDLPWKSAAGLRDQSFSVLSDEPAEPVFRQMRTIQILCKPDDALPVDPPGDFPDSLLLPFAEDSIVRIDLPLSAAGEIAGRSDTVKARIVRWI